MNRPPLAVDWQPNSWQRVWIGGHDVANKTALVKMLSHTTNPPNGSLDTAIVTPKDADEAAYFAGKLRKRLDDRQLWIAIPSTSIDDNSSQTATQTALEREMSAAGFHTPTLVEISIEGRTEPMRLLGFQSSTETG
ncbi:MAG: hypothetical protein ACPGXK_08925 [Phycisphaerae bacterium]